MLEGIVDGEPGAARVSQARRGTQAGASARALVPLGAPRPATGGTTAAARPRPRADYVAQLAMQCADAATARTDRLRRSALAACAYADRPRRAAHSGQNCDCLA